MLKFGGLYICLMINCNFKSFVVVIVGVEWVMCWLLKGMYEWNKFIILDEFYVLISIVGFIFVDCKGFVFNLILWSWLISDWDLLVNYVIVVIKF